MKLYDTFYEKDYSAYYQFAKENDYLIITIDDGVFMVVERPVEPEPTIAEQNEIIRQKREDEYKKISDPLKMDYDEALARGEASSQAKRDEWLASKDKIREENPYIIEENTEKKV